MAEMTELGEEGIQYLRALLGSGDHLAEALSHLPLTEGKVWTYLPEGTNANEVSLDWGSPRISSSAESSGKPIVDLITRHLSDNNALFVLELDSLPAECVAGIFEERPILYFTANPNRRMLVGDRDIQLPDVVGVYGYIRAGGVTRKDVSSLLMDRRPFGSAGALTTTGEEMHPLKGEEISDLTIFDKIAARTRYILGTAYDDEGWIIWGRNRLPEIST